MKKVALTVAVLTLGLAACQDNAPDNNTSTVNTVETEAASDINSSLNAVDNGANAADNALDNATADETNATDANTTNAQ
jgi:hypothetical protein